MIEAYKAAVGRLENLVSNVKPEQYTNSTPCESFDVKALLNHIVGGQHLFAAVGSGGTVDRSAPTPDFVGSDPLGALKTASQKTVEVWSDPQIMSKSLTFPFGTMPGARGFGLMLMEMHVHAWDLAKATDQDPTIPEPAASMLLGALQSGGVPDDKRGPEGSGAAFLPKVDVAEDASTTDKIVANLGRKP
ncbi:MAG: TIGR03086 family metal-binding protein [Actinomycetota bacterium]